MTDIAPWKKTSCPLEVRACYVTSIEVLRVVGICLQPFLPEAAGRLLDCLGVPINKRNWADLEVGDETIGKAIISGVKLF